MKHSYINNQVPSVLHHPLAIPLYTKVQTYRQAQFYSSIYHLSTPIHLYLHTYVFFISFSPSPPIHVCIYLYTHKHTYKKKSIVFVQKHSQPLKQASAFCTCCIYICNIKSIEMYREVDMHLHVGITIHTYTNTSSYTIPSCYLYRQMQSAG